MGKKLRDFLKENNIPIDEENLTDEQKKVFENQILLQDETKNLIPKSRFDEVNNQKKEALTQLEEQKTQLQKLQESAKGNEELQTKITELQKVNEAKIKEFSEKEVQYQRDLAKQDKKNRVILEITKMNPYDPADVLGFVNLDLVNFTENGTAVGINEQLNQIKEAKPYLFKQEKQPQFKGTVPPGSNSTPPPNPNLLSLDNEQHLEKLSKLSDEEYYRLKREGKIKSKN